MDMKKILIIIYFFPLLTLQSQTAKYNLDDRILLNISENNAKGYGFYRTFTDIMPPLSIATPLTVTGIGLLQKDKVMTKKGLVMTAAFGLTTLETYILKYSIKRPRPYTKLPIARHENEGSWSFPSGHTSAAFASATSLTLAYPRWQVAVPAFALASLTGYSRMRLGVHYPSDVLVGAALGVATSFLTWKVAKRWGY